MTQEEERNEIRGFHTKLFTPYNNSNTNKETQKAGEKVLLRCLSE